MLAFASPMGGTPTAAAPEWGMPSAAPSKDTFWDGRFFPILNFTEFGPLGADVLQYPEDFVRWAENLDAHSDSNDPDVATQDWEAEDKHHIVWLRHRPKHDKTRGIVEFWTPLSAAERLNRRGTKQTFATLPEQLLDVPGRFPRQEDQLVTDESALQVLVVDQRTPLRDVVQQRDYGLLQDLRLRRVPRAPRGQGRQLHRTSAGGSSSPGDSQNDPWKGYSQWRFFR